MDNNKALRVLRKCCRFICHQKPERCFVVKGYLFPVCARCTGIIISFIAAIVLMISGIYLNKMITLVFVMIMFGDWLLQAAKIKESTNSRRFITGLIGGFGMSYFYYYIVETVIGFLS